MLVFFPHNELVCACQHWLRIVSGAVSVHAFVENLEMRHLVSGSGFQAFLIPACKQCTATGIAF